MKFRTPCLLICSFLLVTPPVALCQGEAAVPFLLISPSTEANGMVGTSVAVKRADPLAALFSPAQVGLAALTTGIRGSLYPSKTYWLPTFGLPDLNYSAWAVQGGVRLNDFVDMPVRVGVGLAYHRVDLNLGTFSVTSPSNPEAVNYFNSYEYASGLTVGVGFEYLVTVGFGYTFRSISSHLGAIGTESEQGAGVADARTTDFGGHLMLPIVELVEAVAGNAAASDPGIQPFADISLGLSVNNIGDEIVYVNAPQADPLPRTARAAVGVAVGARSHGWELGGVTWSREAEDLLVVRHSEGLWEYQSGLGDIEFGNNVIAGNPSDNVALRTGWQVQLGEVFTYRQGTLRQTNYIYDTDGMTFQLAGILKGLVLAAGEGAPSWLLFARDHIDVQYHQSEYTSETNLLSGTQFKGLTFVVQGLPL